MSRLIKTEIAAVDKDLAQILLSTNIYPRQRPIRANHVEKLSDAMKTGTFKPGTVELCRWKDTDYLMDGQHRLNAIVLSDTCHKMNIAYYEAESEDDLNAHYYRTDNNAKRSMTDVFRASALDERWNIEVYQLRKYGAAITFIVEQFESSLLVGSTLTTERRFALMEEYLPAEHSFLSLTSGISNLSYRCLSLAAIQGVALITLLDQPEKASTFWGNVARNDGLRSGTPEHTLLTALTEDQVSKKNVRKDPWKMRAASCAWNAFYAGKPLTKLAPRMDTPCVILGTRYAK